MADVVAGWAGAEAAFAASAPSLHNPDFAAVVVHSCRHRFGLVAGDPAHDATEAALAARPPITVPTVVLEAQAGGVLGLPAAASRERFIGPYRAVAPEGVGHDVPQETPAAFADAVRALA